MLRFCPKCKKKTEFYEIDDGPDVDDEQVTYTSYNCEICNIHLDGSNDTWYDGDEVSCYLHIEYAKPFMTAEEFKKLQKSIWK